MQPISVSSFNDDGTMYAYSVGYDWSRGTEGHLALSEEDRRPHIMVTSCFFPFSLLPPFDASVYFLFISARLPLPVLFGANSLCSTGLRGIGCGDINSMMGRSTW